MNGMKIERVYYDSLDDYYARKRNCPMCGIQVPDAEEYRHPDGDCKLSGYTAIRRGAVTRWNKPTEREKRLADENAMLKEALRATDLGCVYCRHSKLIRLGCIATDVECADCTEQECPCRSCRDNSNWEWGPPA